MMVTPEIIKVGSLMRETILLLYEEEIERRPLDIRERVGKYLLFISWKNTMSYLAQAGSSSAISVCVKSGQWEL